MKTLKIAPLFVRMHAKLFDERRNMLVPHLTSSNNPQKLVKHLSDPPSTLTRFSRSWSTNPLYPTSCYQLTWQQICLYCWNSQQNRPASRSLRPTNIIRYGKGSWVKKSLFLWCTFARITLYFSPSYHKVWMKLNNGWRKEGTVGHITHKVTTDETVPTAECFSSALQTHSQLFLNKTFFIIKLCHTDDKILLRGQKK